MEQDNFYKELLQKVSEKPSPAFTSKVMEAVNNLQSKPFVYKPLVPAVIKRIFIRTFLGILVLILVTCLMVAVEGIDFISIIKLPYISTETIKEIATIILLFWVIYATNYWMTGSRKLVSSNR